MKEMLAFYVKKYSFFDPLIALKSVNYFKDIDPPKLKKDLLLDDIKERINLAVLNKHLIFKSWNN